MSTGVLDDAIGKASSHRENRSVITRMDFFPVSALGYGPIRSSGSTISRDTRRDQELLTRWRFENPMWSRRCF